MSDTGIWPNFKRTTLSVKPQRSPHSRKSISWLVTRGPETTEEHQQINHLSALTCHFRSFPIQDSLPSVKRGQTHLLGHFPQPASRARLPPCFHPFLTLLSKMNLSQACSFSTSLIRFLLWSCEKRGAPDWSWEGGTTCRPLPETPNTRWRAVSIHSKLGPRQIKNVANPFSLKFSLIGD